MRWNNEKNEKIIGFQAVARDITQRKQMEEILRNERDKAQKILDVTGVILLVIDKEQNVALINRKGCEVLGYDEWDTIGKNWFRYFVPERMRKKAKEAFLKILNEGANTEIYYENPILTKRGEKRYILWHNTPLKDESCLLYTSPSPRDS